MPRLCCFFKQTRLLHYIKGNFRNLNGCSISFYYLNHLYLTCRRIMIVLHEKGKPFYQKNYGKSNMFSLPFAALCFKKLYYALMKLPTQGRQSKSLCVIPQSNFCGYQSKLDKVFSLYKKRLSRWSRLNDNTSITTCTVSKWHHFIVHEQLKNIPVGCILTSDPWKSHHQRLMHHKGFSKFE